VTAKPGGTGSNAVPEGLPRHMSQLTSSTGSATAADLLGPLLRQRVEHFRAREVEVRLAEADALHRFRVSARRLRSLLTTSAALLDPGTCEALDAELKVSARTVSDARDAQVVRRRLGSLLGDEPDSDAVVQLRSRLDGLLEASYDAGWQQAITYFDGSRYDSFTRVLDGFADLPPWTPAAETAAAHVFAPALRREWMRLLRKGRRVQLLEAGSVRDEQLHEVRKAAKRVKDLADVQASVSGRKVRRLGKAADRLKTVLGEHQDLVVTGALLERASGDVPGANSVVLRIRSRETAQASELYDKFVRIFRDADRKSLRAWMS